jgi:hypothetical protein
MIYANNVQLVPWPFAERLFGRSNQLIMRPLGVNEKNIDEDAIFFRL